MGFKVVVIEFIYTIVQPSDFGKYSSYVFGIVYEFLLCLVM